MVIFDISKELRKLIHSGKSTNEEPDYITLAGSLNKIEAIQKRKKRIELLRDSGLLPKSVKAETARAQG